MIEYPVMDTRTYQGELAEISVAKELIKQSWHIFDDVTGKAPIDIIAYKDGIVKKIAVRSTGQIKTTNYRSYRVEIASIRGSVKRVVDIDRNNIDILAVYLSRDDIVCFVPIDAIKNRKRSFTIRIDLPRKKMDRSRAMSMTLNFRDYLKL